MVDRPPLPLPSTVGISTPLWIIFTNAMNLVLLSNIINGNQHPALRVTSRAIICRLDSVTCQLDGLSIDFDRNCDRTAGAALSVKLACPKLALGFLGVMKQVFNFLTAMYFFI